MAELVPGRLASRVLLPWAASLILHGGLALLIWRLPAQATPPPLQPPIEVIDRKLPEPEPPELKPEPQPEPRPSQAPRLAMTSKLPPRPRLPSQPSPRKPSSATEPEPQDTGPKTFGLRLEGQSTAAPGEGVAVPSGDSLRVDPRITKKGKAPTRKVEPTGFKTEYATGEEAPVAVISAYPKVIKQVTAEYPERMKELGIEGKVILELTVDANGKVSFARLVKTLHQELDRVALAAARQLFFSPALMGKTPVKVKIPYTFTFVLD